MAGFSKAQSPSALSEEEFQEMLKKQQQAYVQPLGVDAPPNYSKSPSVRAADPTSGSEVNSSATTTKKTNVTVQRTGGGKTWEDASLLEWDPSHFRLFVGNLSAEVTDDMLAKAFAKYESVSKVRVVVNPKTGLGKGFAFISFKSPDDYFKAYKEMDGKYVGNHPIQLKRATTEIKPQTTNKGSKHKNKYKARNSNLHGGKPYERKTFGSAHN